MNMIRFGRSAHPTHLCITVQANSLLDIGNIGSVKPLNQSSRNESMPVPEVKPHSPACKVMHVICNNNERD